MKELAAKIGNSIIDFGIFSDENVENARKEIVNSYGDDVKEFYATDFEVDVLRLHNESKLIDFKKSKDLEKYHMAFEKIDDFTEKLGESIYDGIEDDSNFTCDMGRYTSRAVFKCKTDNDYNFVSETVCAICGWGIGKIIDDIIEKDREGYCWNFM